MKIIRELSQDELDSRAEEKEYLNLILDSIDKPLQKDVKDRVYTIEHKNDSTVFFTDEIKQKTRADHKQAKYWYRAMSAREYELLRDHNAMKMLDFHAGIAPYFDYSKSYITNGSANTHLVEFRLTMTGQELINKIEQRYKDNRANPKRTHEIKPENGTLSIGLGKKGFYWGTAGVVFNELLSKRQITWALVYFKIDLDLDVQQKVKNWKEQKGIS